MRAITIIVSILFALEADAFGCATADLIASLSGSGGGVILTRPEMQHNWATCEKVAMMPVLRYEGFPMGGTTSYLYRRPSGVKQAGMVRSRLESAELDDSGGSCGRRFTVRGKTGIGKA